LQIGVKNLPIWGRIKKMTSRLDKIEANMNVVHSAIALDFSVVAAVTARVQHYRILYVQNCKNIFS
jgi:hypothetical protein